MSNRPETLNDIRALLAAAPGPDGDAIAAAEARNGQLTKPPGALGRLEDLAIWMGGWQGTDKPHADAPQLLLRPLQGGRQRADLVRGPRRPRWAGDFKPGREVRAGR